MPIFFRKTDLVANSFGILVTSRFKAWRSTIFELYSSSVSFVARSSSWSWLTATSNLINLLTFQEPISNDFVFAPIRIVWTILQHPIRNVVPAIGVSSSNDVTSTIDDTRACVTLFSLVYWCGVAVVCVTSLFAVGMIKTIYLTFRDTRTRGILIARSTKQKSQ